MDSLYIVIPAYNEIDNIEEVIKDWHSVVASAGKGCLLVIDDGSKDDTYKTILDLKKSYPFLQPLTKPNSGHGATVLFGYEYALDNDASFVFQTDSDGQTDPQEFWEMWNARNSYDFQCGWRIGRQDGFGRKMVTRVLKLVVLARFHCWIKDANTPFRLMNAKTLKEKIKQIPKDYNLANVMLSVLYQKDKLMRKRYIRITFRPRQGGANSLNMSRIVSIGSKAIGDFGKMNKGIKQ